MTAGPSTARAPHLWLGPTAVAVALIGAWLLHPATGVVVSTVAACAGAWAVSRPKPGLDAVAPGDRREAVYEHVRHEIEVARRYRREFVLVAFDLARPDAGRGRRWRPAPADMAAVASLRETDVHWVDDGQLYVLLPAAEHATAGRFVERLVAQYPDVLAKDSARRVTFPEDGLTLAALLAGLERTPPVAAPRLAVATELLAGVEAEA